MKLIETKIKGAFVLLDEFKEDSRGGFCKLYNEEIFKSNNLDFHQKEIYTVYLVSVLLLVFYLKNTHNKNQLRLLVLLF